MKAPKIPHVFTLLTGVVFVCSLLTFVIPSGEYEREALSVGGHDRTVVVPTPTARCRSTIPQKACCSGTRHPGRPARRASRAFSAPFREGW